MLISLIVDGQFVPAIRTEAIVLKPRHNTILMKTVFARKYLDCFPYFM